MIKRSLIVQSNMQPDLIQLDINEQEDRVCLSMDCLSKPIQSIAFKIETHLDQVKMSPENWESLFHHYMDTFCIGLTEDLKQEQGDGLFLAEFCAHKDHIKKAHLMKEILGVLFENTDKLILFVKNYQHEIPWA